MKKKINLQLKIKKEELKKKLDIKDGEPGSDGSPDTGHDIVLKINSLPISPSSQIDASHIKNLTNLISSFSGKGAPIWGQIKGDISNQSDLYTLLSGSDIYDILIDDTTTANMTYVGKAAVGSATSSAVWRIARCDITTGTNVITYADGNGNFDNEWDDRATLSYS